VPTADKKIKILFFYPNEFLGPEWTVFTHIIRYLDRDRFTPYVVLNSDAEGEAQLSEADGVILRRWKFGRALRGGTGAALRSWGKLPTSLLSLARWGRKEGIDILQCVAGARTGTLGYLVARGMGARLLLHYHQLPGRYAGPRRWMEYEVGRRAERAVSVSRFVADQIPRTGMPADRIDVVINGANLTRFNPGIDGSALRAEYGIPADAPLVLQLGRLYQGKRQEDTVRAFAIAHRRVPALRCLIVGWEDPRYTGSFPGYKAELLDIAAKEGLGDRLIIGQARPEAPQLMAAADMVIMPSLDDPCPLVVTEAMAAGNPVIGANSGGVPELIADGVTGYLVPPKSPDALADKMVALANDPVLCAIMSQAARQRAELYFNESRLAAEFAPIYESLALTPGSAPDKISLQPQP
jgi:glycosyltransferase involved in cell wall biosynthesis